MDKGMDRAFLSKKRVLNLFPRIYQKEWEFLPPFLLGWK